MPAWQAQYGPCPGSFFAPQKRNSDWAGSPEIAATRLPTRWSGTTLAVNQKALALLDKLKGKPEDNDTSKSLAGAAAKKRQELSPFSSGIAWLSLCMGWRHPIAAGIDDQTGQQTRRLRAHR